MSSNFNRIEDTLRKKNIKDVSTQDLIEFLYLASKNPELRNYDEQRIENYFYKINYSFFFENIFTNKTNYTGMSIYLVGLLIPFYINYPKFYQLGGLGFFIGLISFVLLYQQINSLYGAFFPSASKVFLIISIVFYAVFFLFLNKLNHISLFFISCIVSFCIINYIYKLILTTPSKNNKYNKYNVKFIDKKNYIQYDENIEKACKEVIKRYGLKLPSGKMLYSYLTVFEMGSNNHKVSDFLTNFFAPIITLLYNFGLSWFFETIINKEYQELDLQVLPIIGGTLESQKYISCQANYVLPIEFNFNSFIHEYYIEKELDDDTYRILLKALKRLNYELLSKYEPKFIKLEDMENSEILKHFQNANNNGRPIDKNHILVQIQEFCKSKSIPFDITDLSEENFISELDKKIKETKLDDKDKDDVLQLFHKIKQTLEVKTDFEKKEALKNNKNNKNINNKNKEDEYIINSKLAIEVLLDDEEIIDDDKKLLKELCENYVNYFQKYIKEKKLYGYNYNILTYPYLDGSIVKSCNEAFFVLIKIISVYILFGRPITSPWMLAILLLIPLIKFNQYIKYFNEDSTIMKYLSMGIDTEYFTNIFDFDVQNNDIENKIGKTITKIIVYLIVTLPFLQFFNNVFYGQTFNPLYMNLIWQAVFIINLIGNFYFKENAVTWNIAFWVFVFILSIILYFVFKKK